MNDKPPPDWSISEVRRHAVADYMAMRTTIVRMQVRAVEQRSQRLWISGHGEGARFENGPMLWWVILDNRMTFCVGDERPSWQVGDVLELKKKNGP